MMRDAVQGWLCGPDKMTDNTLAHDPETYVAMIEGRDKRIAELERRVSSLDCRYAGKWAETSGCHCPLDAPCARCASDRRIAELDSSLKEAGRIILTSDYQAQKREWSALLARIGLAP